MQKVLKIPVDYIGLKKKMFPKNRFFIVFLLYSVSNRTFSFLTLQRRTLFRLHDMFMHSLGNSEPVSDYFSIGTFFRVCKEMSSGVFLVENHTHLISGHTTLAYGGGIHYTFQ